MEFSYCAEPKMSVELLAGSWKVFSFNNRMCDARIHIDNPLIFSACLSALHLLMISAIAVARA